jgi:type II secretory pathway pseudopilin PulG
MNKRVYGAFTLVEMLVVMGILIILMVVGISAGSFALNRASDVAHRNGADQLYEGLQAYYIDHRSYPKANACTGGHCTPGQLMTDEDMLGQYMELGSFNAGSDATYIYFVGGSNNDQAVLVCVTMRGIWSVNHTKDNAAVYCAGNGFGTLVKDSAGAGINVDIPLIEKSTVASSPWMQYFNSPTNPYTTSSDWVDDAWVGVVTP